VVVPAAGRSTRFGGANKLLAPLRGRSVLARTLDAFTCRRDVGIIVLAAQDPDELKSALEEAGIADPRIRVCRGGACRAESVRCALEQLPENVQRIAIHDAARPLVSQPLIDRVLAAAAAHGAAVPAMPVTLTIKQASGPLPAAVERTIPRGRLWAMQTPQAMRLADLRRGFELCDIPLEEVTDDAQLVEMAGGRVWLVEGEERNLKITTPIDLRIAELLLESPC